MESWLNLCRILFIPILQRGNERMRMSSCLQIKGNTAVPPVFRFFDKIEPNKMKKKKFQEQIIVKKAINDGLTII